MKEIYIVTGANGHLGNTIVKKLVAQNKQVRCLVLPNDKVNSLQNINCKIYFGDVTCKASLKDIFEVPSDTKINVIHCAAIVSISSKFNKQVYDVNVNGTKNIVDYSIEKNVNKFVHVSSVHAIPEGKKGSLITEVDHFDKNDVKGLYAKTKAEASQYVLDKAQQGFNACIVHPSGIIGPNDFGHGHLTQLVIDYLSGRLNMCVKGGYDFVDVRDVADGVISAVQNGQKGQCYLLTGHYMSIIDMLNLLADKIGHKKIKTMLPMWLAKATAPLAELYYKTTKQTPLFTSYSLYTLGVNSNFTNQKAKEQLGYTTRDLDETLMDTASWLKLHGRIVTKEEVSARKKALKKAKRKA